MSLYISKQTSNITKFLCALIILAHHIAYVWEVNFYYNLLIIAHVAMFTFLFLSGYGLVQSYYQNGLKDYWGKKFRKIYIPAVCVNIFAALELLIFNKIEYNRDFIFKDVLLLHSEQTINLYLWFLHLLIIWYIAFYFVYYYISKKKQRLLIWGLVILLMWYMTPEIYSLGWAFCLSFGIGVIYAEVTKDRVIAPSTIRAITISLLVILLIGGWMLLFHGYEPDLLLFGKKINFWIYSLFTNIVYGCGTFLLCLVIGRICNKWLNLQRHATILGGMSLLIYYLQKPLVVDPIIWTIGVWQKIVVMIIGVGVTMIISYVYAKYSAKGLISDKHDKCKED